SLGTSSLGKCCASSHSRTCGRISVSANSRTLRRSSSWSSVKRKSISVQSKRVLLAREAPAPLAHPGKTGTAGFARRRGRRAPGGVRRAVLDQPAVEEAGIGLPPHAVPRVERQQRALQRGQPVEGHAGEVVVLEVVVRIEEREVPEPVAADER